MRNILIMAALAVFSTAYAAEVSVGKAVLGSGTPMKNASGLENATLVDNAKVENNIFHVPRYLPYHPTAATIYPRVVELDCEKTEQEKVKCPQFYWTPSMGRAEYLFITPKITEPIKPMVVTNTIVKEVPVVKEVLVEVPRKKKAE